MEKTSRLFAIQSRHQPLKWPIFRYTPTAVQYFSLRLHRIIIELIKGQVEPDALGVSGLKFEFERAKGGFAGDRFVFQPIRNAKKRDTVSRFWLKGGIAGYH